MAEYRIYRVDDKGHISQPPKVVDCESEQEAVEMAYRYFDRLAVEIWDGARFVIRLPAQESQRIAGRVYGIGDWLDATIQHAAEKADRSRP
jgi:hypothetical protein